MLTISFRYAGTKSSGEKNELKKWIGEFMEVEDFDKFMGLEEHHKENLRHLAVTPAATVGLFRHAATAAGFDVRSEHTQPGLASL